MKQFYQFITTNIIKKCPENGNINGSAISNLNKYFNSHVDVANNNGYYLLEEIDNIPKYDSSKQYIEYEYMLKDNIIYQTAIIRDFEDVEIITPGE